MIVQGYLKTAAAIWADIKKTAVPADRWLGNFFHRHRKRYGARDRRFLAETIYASFRHKRFIEAWMDALNLGGESDATHVLFAAASENLITAEQFSDLLHLSDSNLKVEGIYRALTKLDLPDAVNHLSGDEKTSIQYSFPSWLYARWLKTFGQAKCERLLAALLKRPSLVVRANPLKISREQLITRFERNGYQVEPTAFAAYGIRFQERGNLFDSEEFREGLFEIQDEGSQIVCEVIDPQPGENIWDVCAGGGGKALYLAARMQNKGRIIATDIRPKKLEDLKKRAKRAGVFNIFPADLNRLKDSREARKGFDKIVVDAPCSGTGTFRRNPDAKWKLTAEQFADYHRDQIAILEKALPSLKKGGRLYYITCSLEPQENEEVIGAFCRKYQGLKPVPAVGPAAGKLRTQHFLQLSPDEHETDGFFMAIMEKLNEGE